MVGTSRPYRLHVINGKCITGCGRPVAPGKIRCQICADKDTEFHRKLYADRIANVMCKWCGRNRATDLNFTCQSCRSRRHIGLLTHTAIIRLEVLKHYSHSEIPYCNCCGEIELDFLSIDHIGGGGNEHRKKLGNLTIFEWLIKNDFPSGFQVLCMNCNWGRARNHGICPHKRKVVWFYTI